MVLITPSLLYCYYFYYYYYYYYYLSRVKCLLQHDIFFPLDGPSRFLSGSALTSPAFHCNLFFQLPRLAVLKGRRPLAVLSVSTFSCPLGHNVRHPVVK